MGVRHAQAVHYAGGGGGNSEGHVGVLKCLNNDETQKKLCVPPVGVNAAAVVEPTFDCCQNYNSALGKIPTDAEFTPASSPANGYILNNGDPTIKEGYWPKSTPDDPTTDNVLNGKSHLGFFNGIAPNDITNVELTTGLEILVRVWKPGATAMALPCGPGVRHHLQYHGDLRVRGQPRLVLAPRPDRRYQGQQRVHREALPGAVRPRPARGRPPPLLRECSLRSV